MDKSRQREHKRVESNLNIFRESIVFIASSILWLILHNSIICNGRFVITDRQSFYTNCKSNIES